MFLCFMRFCLDTFALLAAFAIPLCFFHAFYRPELQRNSERRKDPSLKILSISNLRDDVNFGVYYLHAFLLWTMTL